MNSVVKSKLLSDPVIKQLFEQYQKKHQKGSGRMSGTGVWDGFVRFLKDSKIISTVGKVVLPAAGAALAGLVTANPLAAGAAGAVGSAGANWIASQGFGKKRKGKKGMRGGTVGFSQMGTGSTAFGTVSSEFGKIRR